jgi:hypothetical protein
MQPVFRAQSAGQLRYLPYALTLIQADHSPRNTFHFESSTRNICPGGAELFQILSGGRNDELAVFYRAQTEDLIGDLS